MMPTTTGAQPSQSLLMASALSQEELKDRLEFGRWLSRLRWWKFHSRSTEAGSGPFRSAKTTPRQFQPAVMALAFYGTLKSTQGSFVCSKLRPLSKPFSTLNSIKSLRLDLTGKYLIGKNLMVRSSGPSKVQKRSSTLWTLLLKESTLYQEDKMASSEFGIMTRESATIQVRAILDPSINFAFLQIRKGLSL